MRYFMSYFIIEQKTRGITLRKMYNHNFAWSEDISMIQFTHIALLSYTVHSFLPLVFGGLLILYKVVVNKNCF